MPRSLAPLGRTLRHDAGDPARRDDLEALGVVGPGSRLDVLPGRRQDQEWLFCAIEQPSELGEGGMGEVWQAQQEDPVRRMVALKVIKLGMDTRQVVARFESARQALALMNHPAIAKVFEAGSTPRGRPVRGRLNEGL